MPTLESTRILNRQRVQPHHANNYGTVHGGNLMKWLDEIGAMSAMRFAGETCVTAGVDEFAFERPIPVGDIALVESYVYAAGRTSIRVYLRAWAENPRTGRTEETTASCFTYVAVGEDGRPMAVPELTVDSDEERARRDRALDHEGSTT